MTERQTRLAQVFPRTVKRYDDYPDARVTKEPRYSEQEVAAHFGVTVQTLRRWRRSGLIKSLRHGRRAVFTEQHIRDCEARQPPKGEK